MRFYILVKRQLFNDREDEIVIKKKKKRPLVKKDEKYAFKENYKTLTHGKIKKIEGFMKINLEIFNKPLPEDTRVRSSKIIYNLAIHPVSKNHLL